MKPLQLSVGEGGDGRRAGKRQAFDFLSSLCFLYITDLYFSHFLCLSSSL